MKKYINFELKKTAQTNVVIEFDTRDYDPSSTGDMNKLLSFAEDVLERDARRHRPRYDFRSGDIELVDGRWPRPTNNNDCGDEPEEAPKPDGWVGLRMRKALEGYEDRLSKQTGVNGVRCELDFGSSGQRITRVAYIGDVRARIEGEVVVDEDVVDKEGNLVPDADLSRDVGETDDAFARRGRMSTLEVLVDRIELVLNPQWNQEEMRARLYGVFDWDVQTGLVRE